ncbi:thioredoxin domain-containing protein [Aureimonas ureilytica]|uniref:thioredoxin domain-containing protein n=1 Tax=Aureimonas ureilytica TaxID=401562 RepID=UPI0003787117|nr:thioredoxin domain-containing protein [Aureimonas ureilytica]
MTLSHSPSHPDRRRLLIGSALAGLGAVLPGSVLANDESPVDSAAVQASGDLPELAYGDPSAPVTVVEYTSLTCGFCAEFHVGVLPEFNRSHIDTGRARLVLREFPLDPRSLAGFMLARCLNGEATLAMIDVLFSQQKMWARAENASAALLGIAQLAGMDRDAFAACLSNKALQAQVVAVQERGHREFGVSGTPTFFIGGQRQVGMVAAADLGALVDAQT